MPEAPRNRRDWPPGERLVVEQTVDGVLLRHGDTLPETTLDQVVGMLKSNEPAKTIEEMDAAVLQEAGRRDRD